MPAGKNEEAAISKKMTVGKMKKRSYLSERLCEKNEVATISIRMSMGKNEWLWENK